MGEASLGAKAPDLVSDSGASSSRGPPAEVVWPPHAYADVGMAVDYANGVPVSLHQQQHHYDRQEFAASDRESALVVYHQEPYSQQQQPSSGTAVETYIQVPFNSLSRLAVAAFREAPVPTSDSEQQQLQHYEQEIEQRAADDMVAMSQVLDLHRSVASSSSRDSVVDISAGLHHGHHANHHHLAARPSSASPSPPPSQSPALLVLPGGAAEEPAAVAALRLESQLTVGPDSAASLGLPMLLDKASLAASCSSSGAAASGLSSLAAPSTSSGSRGGAGAISLTAHFSQRYLLEQAQYLVADLASKDLLPSILQGPCSSAASTSSGVPSSPSPVACSSSSVHGLNFSLGAAAKAMLATQQQQHKFATGSALQQHAGPSSAVGAAGSVSAMDASPERLEDEALEDDEAVLDSSSSAGHGALLEVHAAGAVPLYGNVFVTERGEVALVSSTGEDAEDLLEDVEQYHTANQVCHQNGAIQNYVSSSADLVDTSNSVEPGIHSTVDSTDSSEHVINTSEAYVDTSSEHPHHHNHHHHHHLQEDHHADYGQQLDLSSTVEASTSSRGVQHSVLRMQGILARRLPELAASPSSSHSMARAEVCSAGGVSAEELEELQGAPVSASGGLHPDSTNSPTVVEMAASSPVHPGPLVSPSHSPGPSSAGGASRQPVDGSCASQFWCEDCNQFYDDECPRHKVQLIVDKPVLTRAWASLPASYLYVHKVSEAADGEPIYGVFAKKNIPKRTQFGPMEGVLQRRADGAQQMFPLFVKEDEEGHVLCLDTSDETQSNWMRFVRPAQSHAEQNIILVQQGTSLYFNTTRALATRAELRVWYSTAYAQRWGLPLLHHPTQPQPQQPQHEPLQLEHHHHRRQAQQEAEQQARLRQQQQQQAEQQQQKLRQQLQQQQQLQQRQLELEQEQLRRQQLEQRQQLERQQLEQQQLQRHQQLQQQLQQQQEEEVQLLCLKQEQQEQQEGQEQQEQLERQHHFLHQGTGRMTGAATAPNSCQRWACFECSSDFCSSEELQLHLNQHEKVLGPGEAGAPPVQPLPQPSSPAPTPPLLLPPPPPPATAAPSSAEIDGLGLRVRGRPPKKQHAARAPLEEMHSLGNESVLADQSSEPANVMVIPKQPAVPGDENRCNVCLKVFQKKYSLKRHLMMHSPEKKYKCSLCDRRFSHPYNRKRHIIRHQQKDDRHKQRRQGQPHPAQKQPREQQASKQQRPPIMSLLALEAVRKSTRRCVSQPSRTTWACPHCRLIFHSADLLELHQPLHQPLHAGATSADPAAAGQSEPCCPECGADFSTRAELIKHVGVHGKRGPPKRDKPPSEATGTDSENHIAAGSAVAPSSSSSVAAPPPQRTHKCSLCYKGFATEDRLAKHYQVHGNDETKPLKCEMCDKRFLNNSALTGHLKTHKGERYFECPICKEKFHVITALKEHVYTHRQDGVYTCPTCDKKFGEYNQVRKHIRAFHTNQRFLCQQCPKVFPRQDKLKLHMLCHSEHREFLCALCGRQFKRKDKLKDHMRRLHGPDARTGAGGAQGGEQSTGGGGSRSGGKGSSSASSSGRPPSAKRFVPKVPPTDYQRFIYKCHTCMLGFKRRGMLVNHMAKRHPSVQLELVPELNLPILRATRDYYCQYCEKVYRSSSKRKAHILKNHPGAALPMSNRCKGGVPSVPGEPNPTFSHMVGSVTTQPHSCCLCHKQYASKAKLLQHQRKKHVEMVALFSTAATTAAATTANTNTTTTGSSQASSGGSRGREADLLTRAMSELTQGLTDLRQGTGAAAFLTTQPLQGEAGNDAENLSVAQQEQVITETLEAAVETTEVTASALDQAQINLLLAQYQQQAALGGNGEGSTDVPVVSMADVVVAPNAQSCWAIVSVTAPGDEAFEQGFTPA